MECGQVESIDLWVSKADQTSRIRCQSKRLTTLKSSAICRRLLNLISTKSDSPGELGTTYCLSRRETKRPFKQRRPEPRRPKTRFSRIRMLLLSMSCMIRGQQRRASKIATNHQPTTYTPSHPDAKHLFFVGNRPLGTY